RPAPRSRLGRDPRAGDRPVAGRVGATILAGEPSSMDVPIPQSGSTNRRMRAILPPGLGPVYLAAFGPLAAQPDGLIGSRGILPAAEYLDRVGQVLGTGVGTYWQLPSLLWIDASDRALHALCWGGVGLSVLLIAGFLPGPSLALLWLFYLSLTV